MKLKFYRFPDEAATPGASTNNISTIGLQFICSFEGFSALAYPDPASGGKPYTIGYGTTVYPDGKPVSLGDPEVTKAQALGFVQGYINKHIAGWLNCNLPQLAQNQFDALCSFIYNVGLANFESSSLLVSIKDGSGDNVITANFNKWVRAAGKVMPGLITRRAAETTMYCNSIYPA